MNVDRMTGQRAAVLAALGDPVRLAVVDALVLADCSPGELGERLGVPTNLMAHHVKVLEEAGLLERLRSEGDRRRSYLRLRPAALDGLLPGADRETSRVVFVCTHNSARSQLAAALWRTRSAVPATSAGTRPAAAVHPRTAAVAGRHGLALERTRPRGVDSVLVDDDLVVTVCDAAHEELEPVLAGRAAPALHWSVPDPARTDTDEAFENAYEAVSARVDSLAPHIHPTHT
jgi:protein-tyrosine-phosphatase/DNA-binding transcriptional ArsR family regulator